MPDSITLALSEKYSIMLSSSGNPRKQKTYELINIMNKERHSLKDSRYLYFINDFFIYFIEI